MSIFSSFCETSGYGPITTPLYVNIVVGCELIFFHVHSLFSILWMITIPVREQIWTNFYAWDEIFTRKN